MPLKQTDQAVLSLEFLLMPSLFRPAVALLILTLTAALAAQDPAKPQDAAKPRTRSTHPKEFKALKYRNIGPAAGGRVSRAAGVPGDPSTYYAATASGGVWKSTDGGTTWKSVFDDQPISSIGSIAVAPSNPERRLRRIRRGQHPRQRRRRQRHLQVDRRRQDLDARLEAGGPDRHDGGAPEERRHRVRRGARPGRSAPTPSAASTARATAARRGSRC